MAVAVTVELLINATWTDISSYVRVVEGGGVDISFGVQRENGIADPSECRFTVDNRDGRFTPKNTAGAYYPYLTRNTPCRVKVGSAPRFAGEISEFPVRWDPSESNVYVPLVASGVLRRLARSNVLDSTLKSAVQGLSTYTAVTGYWPIEDAAGSQSIASAIPGAAYGTITAGAPGFGAVDPGVMSKPVATWNAGAQALFVPNAASSTEFTAFVLVSFPSSGLTGGEEFLRVTVGGTAQSWRLMYSPYTGGSVLLQVVSAAGVEILSESPGILSVPIDGATVGIKLEVTQNGGNVDWYLTLIDHGADSGSIVGQTVAAPRYAQIGAGTIGLTADIAVGHLILASTNDALFQTVFDQGMDAYAGEEIGNRMARLATQSGIPITVTENAQYQPVEMGVQPDGSLLDVLRASEKADVGGILRDAITTPGELAYITRTGRYNDQRALMTLDYASGHITFAEPTDDDQNTRNDVTAERVDGSSARIVDTTGPLSAEDYPDGVGPYRFADTYATWKDEQLIYVASWLLKLGTIDETRWPVITIDLVRNPSLVTAWELVRPGFRVRLTNLPALAGAATVDLQCIGWTEQITSHQRRANLNCVPGDVWDVFELDDSTFGRLDQMYLAL